jgi:hypothetical protein
MNPTLLSTQNALRSCTGESKARPAAMNVERLMRCEEGEYDGAETPDRGLLRQKVVGRTEKGGTQSRNQLNVQRKNR